MKTLEEIAELTVEEVKRAREMWGIAFDEKNTLNDWITYVNIYLSKAASMGIPAEEVKKNVRKAAGLVLSALYHAENDILAQRHYDGQQRPASSPDIQD